MTPTLRTMYDSVACNVPKGADLVAAYVDGEWANLAEMKARFPNAWCVQRTVTGRLGVAVYDITQGGTTADGARWAKSETKSGRRPTLYCFVATLPDLHAAIGAAGVPLDAVDFWVAAWTGDQPSLAGLQGLGWVGCQYLPGADTGYDESVVLSNWRALRPA